MALVDNNMCPYYKQGIPFMWYTVSFGNVYTYEFDDRQLPTTKAAKFRNMYKNTLQTLQQKYFNRELSFVSNLKRIGLELIDSIVTAIDPTAGLLVRENKFQEIEQSYVKELGIMGNGGRIYFDTYDGIFHLDGNRDLNVFFYHNGERVNITNNTVGPASTTNRKYQNLIERHNMSYDFDLTKGVSSSSGSITGWSIGYRGYTQSSLSKFSYELTYTLPLGQPNYITLLICSHDIDATIDLHLTYLANDDSNTIKLPKGETLEFMIRF